MDLSFFIARRYLLSKKSINAIHFISGISTLGVFVGSAALIIILSVFNGFEHLALSLYSNFTSELRIEPLVGKTFNPTHPYLTQLKKDARVANYVETLEEKVLLRYDNSQFIGLMKGVTLNYFENKQLSNMLFEGELALQKNGLPVALIGAGVQNSLSVNVANDFEIIEVFSPKKNALNSTDPSNDFNVKLIHPVGTFRPEQHFDDLILVPIEVARELLIEPLQVSAIEIDVKEGVSIADFQEEIIQNVGKNFKIKNRSEQNPLLYKIVNTEKWAVYVILTFVLIIAIFNIIGSLTMLVIDKQKDIAILSSLGASKSLIQKIFFIEGMMISMIGCLIGMWVALIFCVLQQRYGFINMGAENLLTEAYPIVLKATDFLLVFITVTFIATVASFISSRLSVSHMKNLKEGL